MERFYIRTNRKIENFINRNQTVINICKKQARIASQGYEEQTRRNAQSKISKINSQDNIKRKDLQSVFGGLNINSENFYKQKLIELLNQIPGITQEIIEVILFTA